MKTQLPAAALLALLINCLPLRAQVDHGHVNAGTAGLAQGDDLLIRNYDDFVGFDIQLTYVPLDYVYPGTGTNLTRYIGYYQGNVTFTALAATPDNGGPEDDAPALGSFIHVKLVSVDGPAGGSFAFWESGATSPTLSMASGTSSGTGVWKISNNNGVADTDPFGHIHGRRFTATLPGEYTVRFQLVDLSTNGANGSPIHDPSPVYSFTFAAAPEPSTVALIAVSVLAGLYGFQRRKGRRE